jgi:NodT family efflux transporter outer membrane factor (OMF) lipoprotein
MKTMRTILMLLTSSAIAGCTVGPDYHRPLTNAPKQWSDTMAAGETDRSTSIATWWKGFGDKKLDSLVARALASNLDLRMAEARVREARAQLGVTQSDLWPTVDANGSYSRQRLSTNEPLVNALPSGTALENDVYQSGFDASWELDVFGGTRRAVEGARANVVAAVFSQKDVQVTLVSEVARNYVEARSYQSRLAIAIDNIKAQQETVALAHRRFDHGLTTKLDVEQAATVLAQTQAQVPALENGLAVSIHRLGVLLGQDPGSLQKELSAAGPIPTTPPVVPVGLPSDLLLRRPDIRIAERQLAAANARIGVATADLFPKFSLTGNAGLESVSASDWFTAGSRYWSVGPTVQWRIFDAGRIRSNIRVQNARQEEALANYENTVLRGFEDVENALVGYAKEKARNISLREAVATSQSTLDLARQQYADGIATFINVLDAERSLYQAQDDLVQSDQRVTQNLIAVYKALGGGWNPPPATPAAVQAVAMGRK